MTEMLADGDPRSERHPEWLSALGRATYEAAALANIAFNLLRVFGGFDSNVMYSDPLGTLVNRLRHMHKSAPWPELALWIASVDEARLSRNDLIHALPVQDGLHRRKSDDPYYVRNFFTIDSVTTIADQFNAVAREGNRLLYSDGGATVRAWMSRD